MSAAGEERRPEIIIVRRGGDDEEDGHHGGVWKIAFADFMTAMMCFFLVMWLINAASEETRVALASYFNPVKLVDRSTSAKGLEEISDGSQRIHTMEPLEESDDLQAPGEEEFSFSELPGGRNLAGAFRHSDENFFSNPYAVLAEIAAETGRDQNISSKGEGGEQNAGPSSGASGGVAYRDPFAPDFWSQQVAVPGIGVEGDPDQAREHPNGADREIIETGEFERAAEMGGTTPPAALDEAAIRHDQPQPPNETIPETSRPTERAADPASESGAEWKGVQTAPAASRLTPNREAAAAQIREELVKALEGKGLAASVTVAAGEDGVLISVTDDIRQGMFAVGSAVPERALVLAMEKIARTLADHSGNVRIHGHTDARPFTSGDYDNWRLSTARAHAAQYMLVRGGLDEKRIKEVAGFADRRLKLPDAPLADANRRIEILLEVAE